MADRYWVGGTGTWDASSTANWATSSGGSSGASAPTSADNVIFDANSDAGSGYTVTITAGVCNDLTMSGLDVATIVSMGDTAQLDIHGSMTLPASNLTWTGAGNATQHSLVNFKATTTGKTITTNGVSIVTTEFKLDGVGGAWTLGSAFTRSGALMQDFTIENGTFSTSGSNYSMTIAGIGTSTSTSRTINLNASTVTITGGSGAVNLTSSTNLTLNAGTSQITCSGAAPTFAGGGLTYYNVSFTSTANNTTTINGANTFNNLTQASRINPGLRFLSLGANQTVSGTLTLGTSVNATRRILVLSDTIGTQRTITCNGTLATLAEVDFRDIVGAGTVTWTGTRIGNCLNNSGITFTTAADKYWNLAAGGDWSGTAWALTSGGAVSTDNFPLAQDKVIIENTGLNTSATITIDTVFQIGEIDISTRTNAMTLANTTISTRFYKNITLSSAVTMTGTGAWVMNGQGTTQILDVNTATFVPPITIESPSGTFQLAENTTCSGTVTLNQGTLDLNDFDLTCNIFSSSNSNTRVIAFGTGEINITGNNNTVLIMGTGTNFTYTGTPTLNFTYSGGTGTRGISATTTTLGGLESNVLNYNISAGTDIIDTLSNRTFKNLNFTGFTGTLTNTSRTIFGNLTISSGMTLTAGTSVTTFSATSGTQEITSAGKTFDFPVTIDGVGGTVELQDALTIGSTRTLTLTNGTLDLNDFDLSTGLFSSNNSNTRVLTLGTGTMTITGSGSTAFDITDGTNLTVNRDTSIINMASASAKTFAGGGKTYYRLNQGGAGILTITGANTFYDITNTTQPATITFPASTTTSVSNFSARGTSGNLISLRSSTPGTQFTLTYIP